MIGTGMQQGPVLLANRNRTNLGVMFSKDVADAFERAQIILCDERRVVNCE